MYFKQLLLGEMDNFIYIIGDPITKKAAVVDPGWDVQAIKQTLIEDGYDLAAILLTHGHPDHTNGIVGLANDTTPIYISADEHPMYKPVSPQVREIPGDYMIPIGELQIKCIHTPGHSSGGLCYLINNKLLTGDTLFIDGHGRFDLPGGNPEVLHHSLTEIIYNLPDNIEVFPGHKYHHKGSDSLGNQKQTNRCLTCTFDIFVAR
jgi:hydroxyacylglutathione hydrolase